jgi:transmembrane sensor
VSQSPDIEDGLSGNPIDATAADWVARMDRGPLSAEDAQHLSAWLAADVRHQGALARAQAAFAYLDRARALGPDVTEAHLAGRHLEAAQSPSGQFTGEAFNDAPMWAPPAPASIPAPSRRALLAGGAAVAASVAGAAVFGPGLYDRLFPKTPAQVYLSKKGEIKLVSLTDESVLTLNTHSLVAVDYTGDRRGVELKEGEVMFSVAKDTARPFSVVAGDLEVRAVGTSFMVRNIEGRPPEVLVQEGMVDVVYRTQPSSLVRAAANTRVTAHGLGVGARLTKAAVSAATVARETAWRQGMIAFEGVSLATAAAEFSRYSETRIVIDDASIATTTITGLFEADNPAGFSHAVAGSLGLKVETGPGFVRLYAE